jgi:hypothetical protein
MSDDEGQPVKESDEDIAKQIEEKCWGAFQAFDKENSG